MSALAVDIRPFVNHVDVIVEICTYIFFLITSKI